MILNNLSLIDFVSLCSVILAASSGFPGVLFFVFFVLNRRMKVRMGTVRAMECGLPQPCHFDRVNTL